MRKNCEDFCFSPYFSHNQHGNYTKLLGPQVDTYLPKSNQYLANDPKMVLELGDYPNIPILMGICSNEGAFIQGFIYIYISTLILFHFQMFKFDMISIGY